MGLEFAAGVGARSAPPAHQLPQSSAFRGLPRQHALPASATVRVNPAYASQTHTPRLGAAADTLDLRSYHMQSLSVESTAELALSLTTAEGDTVTLRFNQADALHRLRFAGELSDHGRIDVNEHSADVDRAVSMSVSGSLSEAELSAINAVIDQVQRAADHFFQGSTAAALDKLQALNFDAATLAEMSLDMTMTTNVEVTQAYAGPRQGQQDQLQRLAERDEGIMGALRAFADAQQELVGMAKGVLDDPSAVSLIRSLLPPAIQARLDEGAA